MVPAQLWWDVVSQMTLIAWLNLVLDGVHAQKQLRLPRDKFGLVRSNDIGGISKVCFAIVFTVLVTWYGVSTG